MDHKIYFPTAADYGVYGTRRYPKGSSPAIAAQTPGIPTDPHDPNSNPVVVQLNFEANLIAPHGTIERWSYTCPPKRRGRIETLLVKISRQEAATIASGTSSNVKLTRAQHIAQKLFTLLLEVHRTLGAVGNADFLVNPGPIELFEGDVLSAETIDQSTGGSTGMLATATLIEYDSLHPIIGAEARFVEGAPEFSGNGGLRRSGGGGGGMIIRSEAPRDPVNWISLGNGYYQRR